MFYFVFAKSLLNATVVHAVLCICCLRMFTDREFSNKNGRISTIVFRINCAQSLEKYFVGKPVHYERVIET